MNRRRQLLLALAILAGIIAVGYWWSEGELGRLAYFLLKRLVAAAF